MGASSVDMAVQPGASKRESGKLHVCFNGFYQIKCPIKPKTAQIKLCKALIRQKIN